MATRRERVVLELQDNFTSGMARAAAAAALLDRELDSLSGSAVRTQRSVNDLNRNDGLPSLGRNAERSGKQIDRLSGRLALLVKTATILGPALVPLGAGMAPAISGLATQLTMTVGAVGTAVLAFHGLGDGLKALNKYRLEPSAENLEKLRIEMEKLGPAGAEFVTFLDSIGPQLRELQMTAREGLFPGMEQGITDLLDLLPQVDRIVGEIAGAMGDLSAEAGAGLSGARFAEFFDYLETEARPILLEMGHTVGNFADGLAAMLVAFGPLTADFSSGFEEMSKSFADWAHGLDSNDSFQAFLDYVSESGPRLLDFLGSTVDLFVGVAEAAAPVGAVVLPALTALLDVVAAIASSPLGSAFVTAAVAMNAYGVATSVAEKATARLALSSSTGAAKMNALAGSLKFVGAGAGLVALSMTDLDEKAGLSNTAMLGMAGLMAGPWGAAIGASAGLLLDLRANVGDVTDELAGMNAAMRAGDADALRAELESVNHQISDIENWTTLGNVLDDLMNKEKGLGDAATAAEARLRMLDDAAGRTEGLDALLGLPLGLSREFDVATDSVEQFSESFRELSNLLDTSGSLIAYEAALDDFTASIKENGNAWAAGTEKGRENLEKRNALVSKAIERSEALKKAGDNLGAQRILDRAISDLQTFAKKSPEAQAKLKPFIAELQRLNDTKAEPTADLDTRPGRAKLAKLARDVDVFGKTKTSTKVDADTKPARTKVNMVDQQLDALVAKHTIVRVEANTSAARNALAAARRALEAMDGKTATMYLRTVRTGAGGTGDESFHYASGGYTGDGGKYEPAGIVHRGEVVIPQEYVKRDWSSLKARYGDLPGMATGGLAGSTYASSKLDPATRAANDLARGLDRARDSLKKELQHRQTLLQHEVSRDKERLDMLRQERQAIVDAVKSGFHTDVFGQSVGDYTLGDLSNSGISAAGQAQMQATLTANQHLAEQAARDQALTSGIAEKKEALRLLHVLRKHGLDGPAFIDLAATGDIATLRAYAEMSRKQLAQYERRTNQNLRLENRLGNYAGNSEMGAEIRAARADYRESTQELKQMNQRLHRLEKLQEKAPKETGEAVGKAVNGAATSGHKARRP